VLAGNKVIITVALNGREIRARFRV